MLTFLILHNVESVYFFYSNAVHIFQCVLERTDAITNEVLEPIPFVLAYPTVFSSGKSKMPPFIKEKVVTLYSSKSQFTLATFVVVVLSGLVITS